MKQKRSLFYGVKRQLFIFSTAIIITLLFIIGFIFISTTSKTLYDLAVTNHTQNTRQMLTDFQKGITSLTNLSQNYLNSPYIQEALSATELSYQSRKYLNSSLYYPNNSYLDYCFYINNDETIYTSSQQALAAVEREDLLPLFYSAAEPTYSKPLLVLDNHADAENEALYMVRKIRHLSVNCTPGLLVFHLGADFYNTIFANVDVQNQCSYYLLNPDFDAAYTITDEPSSQNTLDHLKKFYDSASAEPYFIDNNVYFTAQDETTGFLLVSVVPEKVLLASSYTFLKTILLVLLLAIVLSIPLILMMSSHFTRPIRYMADVMKGFSTDSLGQPIAINTNTELDTISFGYNQMLDNILNLLDTIQKDQSQLRANEYNLLLHQINPHFLYNTLDNIHMLARLDGDDKMVTLICELSSYLRTSLSKGHETISVSMELSHIESYMRIEQIRTNSLFAYTIQAEPDVQECLIPKLILQPLVENSIKYGFANLNTTGHITITVEKSGNQHLALVVHNTGTPINPEIMKILNEMPAKPLEEISDTFPTMPGGYGIANVICRLKLRYGADFSMFYEEESGTQCTIRIPKAL